jgi:hypothetical protein
MKKILMLAAPLVLFACDNVEKLDKQLYDSTETNVPVTKLDQLEQLDKQDAAADSTKVEDPKK